MTTHDAIARLARGQHGAFSRRQARSLGCSDEAIKHAERQGNWEHVVGDVVRFPGAPRTWKQELMIATLAGGPDAVASHLSAAALLQFPGFREGRIETLRLRGSDHQAIVGKLRETRVLPPHHLVVVDGIPTTNVGRTIFDLAGLINPDRTERALDTQLVRHQGLLPKLDAMLPELAERGRRGIRVMRRLLDVRVEGCVVPESDAEAYALSVLRQYGVPEGVAQVDVGNAERWIGRIDRYYRAERVILEIDSRLYHGSELDQREDARRRASYAAQGWRVIAVFYADIRADPAGFARLVATALSKAA